MPEENFSTAPREPEAPAAPEMPAEAPAEQPEAAPEGEKAEGEQAEE